MDRYWRHAAIALWTVAGLGLFARILSEEMRKDEHMFVPGGAYFWDWSLYSDFSFSHLPNLALLLGAVFGVTGTDHYLLVGRLIVTVAWAALLGATYLTAARVSGSRSIGALGALLLITNSLFISHVGLIVSNNIFAAAASLWGAYFFIRGLDEDRVHPWRIVVAGFFLALAAGFKVNFIVFVPPFVAAAFLLPRAEMLTTRLLKVVLPLAVGGVIGGLPSLIALAVHFDATIFNTLEFHLGPHRAYWSEPANAAQVEGLTLAGRLLYAYQEWVLGSSVLIFVGLFGLGALIALRGGAGELARRGGSWAVILLLGATGAGVLICFAVKPSFPQYYMPPIPFAIVLLAAVYGTLSRDERPLAAPLMITLALSAVLMGAPRLLGDLPALLRPGKWTGNSVHTTAESFAAAIKAAGFSGKVATLRPIYALEAGLPVYPEFATGPFYYRIGDYLTPEQRQAFNVVSPGTLAAFLDADPPAAILVGFEPALDAPFIAYAQARGYRRATATFAQVREGVPVLYLRAQAP